MIGPLVAFALLAAAPDAFSTLFLISFFVAMLGFGVITLLVREPKREGARRGKPDLKARGQAAPRAEFRALTLAGSALGLATASDGFIYLTLRDQVDFCIAVFPLLATGTGCSTCCSPLRSGRFSDRFGRGAC